MNTANDDTKKGWKSRLKLAVAGLALAGALAGGVSVAADQPVPAEDTTETAGFAFRAARWGVSWR